MREEERKRTRKQRTGPKKRTLCEKIEYLAQQGFTRCEIYEHLVMQLQIDYLCSENARDSKKLLGLDAWHTTVEFGYWVD